MIRETIGEQRTCPEDRCDDNTAKRILCSAGKEAGEKLRTRLFPGIPCGNGLAADVWAIRLKERAVILQLRV